MVLFWPVEHVSHARDLGSNSNNDFSIVFVRSFKYFQVLFIIAVKVTQTIPINNT